MNYDDEFSELASCLEKLNFKWIVLQVSEEISTGKFIEKKIHTLRENVTDEAFTSLGSKYKKGQKADFVVREEYSPREKLILLLEAIRRGIFEPTEMERYLVSELDASIDRIEFYSESLGVESTISRNRLAPDHFVTLKKPIDEQLEQLVKNND